MLVLCLCRARYSSQAVPPSLRGTSFSGLRGAEVMVLPAARQSLSLGCDSPASITSGNIYF